jgi:hypothetical protein
MLKVSKNIVLFLFLILILGGSFSQATQTTCQKSSNDIALMKSAYQQLLNSIQTNQKLIIDELNSISAEAELNQGQISKIKILELKNKSLALQKRSQNSSHLIEKLNQASNALLSKLASCKNLK